MHVIAVARIEIRVLLCCCAAVLLIDVHVQFGQGL